MYVPLEDLFDLEPECTAVEHAALKQAVLGCSVVSHCCPEGYLFFPVLEAVQASLAGDLSDSLSFFAS